MRSCCRTAGRRCSCGKAPGVRNAKETDQDRTVDKILRRREGAENLQSRFVTLFESSAVPSGDWLAAERLPVRGNPTAVAVKVMRPDGTDLILTATAPGRFETELDGTPVRFDGSAAVWSQSSGKRTGELVAVGGERFEFGTAGVSAGGVITGRLKSNPGGLATIRLLRATPSSTLTPICRMNVAAGRFSFRRPTVLNPPGKLKRWRRCPAAEPV